MNPGIDSVEVVRVTMRLLYPLSTGGIGIIKGLLLKMTREVTTVGVRLACDRAKLLT
jgi:hypothetical protein